MSSGSPEVPQDQVDFFRKSVDEQLERGDNVESLVCELQAKGFSGDQARQLVAAVADSRREKEGRGFLATRPWVGLMLIPVAIAVAQVLASRIWPGIQDRPEDRGLIRITVLLGFVMCYGAILFLRRRGRTD